VRPANKSLEQTNGALSEMMAPFAAQRRRSADMRRERAVPLWHVVVAATIAAATVGAACGTPGSTSGEARDAPRQSPTAGQSVAAFDCEFSSRRPLPVVDDPSHLLKAVKPDYPRRARRAGVSGAVAVKLLVDGSGRPSKACAVTGPGLLRRAAEEAALQFEFEPMLLNGEATEFVATHRFVFKLEASRKSAK
jgi:TonB family protein